MSIGSVAAALVALLLAGPAYAHGTLEGVSDFMASAWHVVTAPEHVLAIVALGLLTAQKGWDEAGAAPLAFPVAFLLAALLSATQWRGSTWWPAAELTVIALGVLTAVARKQSPGVLAGIAIVIGAVHGVANGAARLPQMALWPFTLGASFSGLAVLSVSMMAGDLLLRTQWIWPPIAVRALGSWIAAIGILSLALGYRVAA